MNTHRYCYDVIQSLVLDLFDMVDIEVNSDFNFRNSTGYYTCRLGSEKGTTRASLHFSFDTSNVHQSIMDIIIRPYTGKFEGSASACNIKRTDDSLTYSLLNLGSDDGITYAYYFDAEPKIQIRPETIEEDLFQASTIQRAPELAECLDIFENTPELIAISPKGYLVHTRVCSTELVNQDTVDMFTALVLKGIEQWRISCEYK